MSESFCIPSVIPDDPPEAEASIANDGWFPDIDPAAFRARLRVRENVTAARLREALIYGIVTVGNQLATWQAERVAEGVADLASAASPAIDGQNRLTFLYHRAVFAEAKAALVERYRDIDTTGNGQRRAEDMDPSIGELRRDAVHAVRDILGRTRTDVELI